jgi:hypothetical protein
MNNPSGLIPSQQSVEPITMDKLREELLVNTNKINDVIADFNPFDPLYEVPKLFIRLLEVAGEEVPKISYDVSYYVFDKVKTNALEGLLPEDDVRDKVTVKLLQTYPELDFNTQKEINHFITDVFTNPTRLATMAYTIITTLLDEVGNIKTLQDVTNILNKLLHGVLEKQLEELKVKFPEINIDNLQKNLISSWIDTLPNMMKVQLQTILLNTGLKAFNWVPGAILISNTIEKSLESFSNITTDTAAETAGVVAGVISQGEKSRQRRQKGGKRNGKQRFTYKNILHRLQRTIRAFHNTSLHKQKSIQKY